MRMGESICQQIMNDEFYFLFVHIKFHLLLDSLLAMEINGIHLQQVPDTKKRAVDHFIHRIRSNFQF